MPPRKVQDELGFYSVVTDVGILRTGLTNEEADEAIRMLDHLAEREDAPAEA